MSLRAWSLLGALIALGCTDPEVVYTYDAYAGPPVFPNRRSPIALPAGEVGFTSDNRSDTVTVVDLAGGEVITSRPVGRNPIDNDGPHHLAVHRERGVLVVALAYPLPEIVPGPHAQHGLSVRAGYVQKLALDDLRPLGEVRIDENPGDIVISDDGSLVAVAHYDLNRALENPGDLEKQRATLALIRTDDILESGSPLPVSVSTCIAPHGVALSRPDGALAFAACYGEDSVAIVDTRNPDAEIVRVPVGSAASIGVPTYGPYSATLSPSGDRVALGNLESRDVRIFDVTMSAMAGITVMTMGQPFFVGWSSDNQRLYIPTQVPDEVVMADAATGQVLQIAPMDPDNCILPHEIVPSSTGDVIYLVCEGDHETPGTVLALDAMTLATLWTSPVGVYPDRLAVIQGGAQ